MQDDGENGPISLDNDEVIDIVTNYLACKSSVSNETKNQVEKLIQEYCSSPEIENEKHYEFYFNLSQIYMKDDDPEQSLFYLREAFKKAQNDN